MKSGRGEDGGRMSEKKKEKKTKTKMKTKPKGW